MDTPQQDSNMTFWIQANNPSSSGIHESLDRTLCEAMESIYDIMTENAIIMWHAIPIPISYKYDLSFMIEDIIILCENIFNNPVAGSTIIYWPSNTFNVVWQTHWNNDIIKIHSTFETVIGGTQGLLNAFPIVEMRVLDFLSEWKTPLKIILNDLTKSGYTHNQIPELIQLKKVIDKISNSGILYKIKN